MTFVSFAQNYEDVILWRALRDVKGGRYLDIGAQDPVIDSVSFAFYKAGWRGIHVEPVPSYASKLREARPDEIVIEAAVSDQPGPIRIFEIPETGLSTGSGKIADGHRLAGYESREIIVPGIRLDQLFDLVESELHWLKIDAEGMEANILRSWGKSQLRPWILIIESTAPNSQDRTHEQWIKEIFDRDYKQVLFDGLSSYFLHEDHRELASLLESPANVFDGFSVADHHFSAAKIRTKLDDSLQRLKQEMANSEQLRSQVGQAWQAYDAARQEQRGVLERLISAEQEHRIALDAFTEHRRASELAQREQGELLQGQLHEALEAYDSAREEQRATLERVISAEREGREREERLRQAAFDSELAAASVRLELARATERLVQVEAQFQRTEDAFLQTDLRLKDSVGEVAQLRTELAETKEAIQRSSVEAEALKAEIYRLRGVLGGAGHLIARAAAESLGRWQRLGEKLGVAHPSKVKPELAAWAASSSPSLEAIPNIGQAAEPTMYNVAPANDRNPYLRAESLSDLLSWNDVNFVRCAFVTVLGRQPDPVGENYYTNRIRLGQSKMKVLWDLRHSSEGKAHDPGIAGFDRELRRSNLQGKPIIGCFFRLIWQTTTSVSPAEESFRAIMNALAINQSTTDMVFGQLLKLRSNTTKNSSEQVADRKPAVVPTPRIVPELEHLRSRGPLSRYPIEQLGR